MKIYLISRRLCILLTLCACAFISYSQTTIRGVVQDGETGTPLAGVSVVDKASKSGTVTNDEGSFTLETMSKGKGVLTIILVGYEQLEVSTTNTKMVIQLTEKAAILDEFVVTALNQKRIARDLGYAVQKLESKDLTEVQSPNFVDNLAGKVAGVTINQGATGVGSEVPNQLLCPSQLSQLLGNAQV